jgi:D-alanine-D-alanine ligase
VFCDKSLGVLELRPKTAFYDYTAKYTEGVTEHIYPAQIPQAIYEEAMKWAEEMHKTLGCRTLSRSDMLYNSKLGAEGLYFLEINTHPGFTQLSILPEIAGKNGISFAALLEQLIQDARCVTTV